MDQQLSRRTLLGSVARPVAARNASENCPACNLYDHAICLTRRGSSDPLSPLIMPKLRIKRSVSAKATAGIRPGDAWMVRSVLWGAGLSRTIAVLAVIAVLCLL